MIKLPDQLKEWTVENEIGRGSYGRVYRIRDRSGSCSALKVIKIPQNRHETGTLLSLLESHDKVSFYYRSIMEEFTKEIELMEELRDCPYVVSVDDHWQEADGDGFIVYIKMEYLHPLPDRMETEEVIKLGIHICSALEYCERKGVLHRDIKRANILLSSEGIYKLCDFGMARAIERSMGADSLKGTFVTMAPEVYRGKAYGHRADIYSVGIMMYMLLNENHEPFIRSDPVSFYDRESALRRRMNGEDLPPLSDKKLSDIVLRAAAYHKQDRFRNAGQMKKALQKLLSGRYRLRRRFSWKVRLRILIIGTFLVSLLCCISSICYQQNIYHFADEVDYLFSPGKIRMIDRYDENLGSVYDSSEIIEGSRQLEQKMIDFAGKDYQAFAGLYIDTEDDHIRSNYKAYQDLPQFPYTYRIPFYQKDGFYLVSRVGYGTEYFGKVYDERSILYTMEKDKVWKNNDNDEMYHNLMEDLMNKGYYPSAYALARREKRPCFMYQDQDYSYLDSSFIYQGDANPYQLKFVWENRDGSIGIVFLFKNNGGNHKIKALRVQLYDDQGRYLINQSFNMDFVLPARRQTLVYKKIKPIEKDHVDWKTLNQELEETGDNNEITG